MKNELDRIIDAHQAPHYSDPVHIYARPQRVDLLDLAKQNENARFRNSMIDRAAWAAAVIGLVAMGALVLAVAVQVVAS